MKNTKKEPWGVLEGLESNGIWLVGFFFDHSPPFFVSYLLRRRLSHADARVD